MVIHYNQLLFVVPTTPLPLILTHSQHHTPSLTARHSSSASDPAHRTLTTRTHPVRAGVFNRGVSIVLVNQSGVFCR